MQLASQSTAVASIGKHLAHQHFIAWNLLTVLPTARRAWITPRQKRRAARCANRALAIRLRERHAAVDQAIDIRRAYEIISQSSDRVVTLLIRAEPEDVRRRVASHRAASYMEFDHIAIVRHVVRLDGSAGVRRLTPDFCIFQMLRKVLVDLLGNIQ